MEQNTAPNYKYDLIKQEQLNHSNNGLGSNSNSGANNDNALALIRSMHNPISNESIEIEKLRSEHFEEFQQLIDSEFSMRRKLQPDSLHPEEANNGGQQIPDSNQIDSNQLNQPGQMQQPGANFSPIKA